MEGTGMQQTPGGAEAPAAYSCLYPIGYSNSSSCGYCRRSRTGQSPKRYCYYASTTSLTPEFYQDLLDRCWRRSGTLLYRPNQKEACCPHYTIRLDSSAFKATRSQRQAINRFNKYILGETYMQDVARLYPLSREQARKRDNDFDLVERMHEAESTALRTPPEPAHQLTVTLEPDAFTEEKYTVFENYQRIVHQEPPDKISRSGFKRFLCDSPVQRRTEVGPDGKEKKLGSYHQCYRIDGRLVAIGVLDLLPNCVSAVYFLYHESIHSYTPGKVGALREIALAREGGYRWWYAGYYIHSCPKMRYKIEYSPQYVLDPETLAWDVLDKEALAIFDKRHYVSLSRHKGLGNDHDAEDGTGADARSQPEPEPEKEPEPRPDSDDDDDSAMMFLFASNFPGIPTLQEMEAADLDHVKIWSDAGLYPASALRVWDMESISQPRSLKSVIAELVAAVGLDLRDQFRLDFRRLTRS
ncbi:hypothetical protein GQ53DRAFT_317700 [Thozetella sp. PMI_491]|nr:hypothetical protein GQ53DRAFT_317700 [Thozetella sp. PMI_491]